MPDITLTVGDIQLEAEWTKDNPTTREAIQAELPLEGDASKWGDELYFRTPVDVPEENSQIEVPVGAVAYWPQGNAVCIFWGPTPASTTDAPRAASPVNVVARITDPSSLQQVTGSTHVRIE